MGFYGNKIIELSVIFEIASVVAFAIAIFEADELNISWDCSLGGFDFFSLGFQFRFFVENVVVNNLKLETPDNVSRIFNAAGFFEALVVNRGKVILAIEGADQNDD